MYANKIKKIIFFLLLPVCFSQVVQAQSQFVAIDFWGFSSLDFAYAQNQDQYGPYYGVGASGRFGMPAFIGFLGSLSGDKYALQFGDMYFNDNLSVNLDFLGYYPLMISLGGMVDYGVGFGGDEIYEDFGLYLGYRAYFNSMLGQQSYNSIMFGVQYFGAQAKLGTNNGELFYFWKNSNQDIKGIGVRYFRGRKEIENDVYRQNRLYFALTFVTGF